MTDKVFIAVFHCVPWQISLGINVSLKPLNFEIHLPLGFLKIGVDERFTDFDIPRFGVVLPKHVDAHNSKRFCEELKNS